MFIIELSVNIIYFTLSMYLPGKIKKIDKEITRKIAHILCGNWIFIYSFLNQFFLSNIISLIYMIILMSISYRRNIFKGVERIGQHKSFGTIYFFISLLVFIIYIKLNDLNSKIYIIYILPLVYGDAFAAIIGKKFRWMEYRIFNNIKSVSGNISMILVSLLTINVYNFYALNNYYSILHLLLIGIFASIMEGISIKGTDNFTIPIITMIFVEGIL